MPVVKEMLLEDPAYEAEMQHSDDSRILVVDDLRSSRMLIGAVLAAAGFTHIDYASDGVEAMAKIRESRPDLLVLDIMMPNMDGFEVCRRVRNDLGLDIPILVQSGIQEAEERVRVFDEGATDLVSKPINAAELISRVRVHVEHRRLLLNLRQYQNRMEEELRTAEAMQISLLKTDEEALAITEPRGAKLVSHYQPSNKLGGDLWQIFPIDEDRFGLLEVDLSGHGVTAAINAFRLHMLIESLTENRGDPAKWLGDLASNLYKLLPVEHFATAFYAVYDKRTQILEFASGAAPAPIVLRQDGGHEALDASGMLLGCADDTVYESRRVQLNEGDRVLLYSDALVEDFKDMDKSLSEDDVADISKKILAGRDITDFPARIIEKVFVDPSEIMRDDLTIILMEVS